MKVWALVPVKPFGEGKSRLAAVLRPEERERLNRRLLTHVLQVLRQVAGLEEIWVLSRDPQVLAVARQHQARTWREGTPADLNLSLQRAVAMLRPQGMEAALVLPADLPLLTPEDVEALLDPLTRPEALDAAGLMAIAPDRHRTGTNGLLLFPPEEHDFAFGPGSFQQHLRLARARGRYIAIVDRPGLAYDLDTPEDWRWIVANDPSWQSLKWEDPHGPVR